MHLVFRVLYAISNNDFAIMRILSNLSINRTNLIFLSDRVLSKSSHAKITKHIEMSFKLTLLFF